MALDVSVWSLFFEKKVRRSLIVESTPTSSKNYDVIVIGGGPAGCMAAYRLAKQGVHVALIEKSKTPHHKVCGEFLSAEGVPLLKSMGIDPIALGGVPLHKFRIHGPKRSGEADLPAPAVGISRYRMDEAMLAQAQAVGVDVRRGVLARALIEDLDGPSGFFRLQTTDGIYGGQRLILATGKAEFKSVQVRAGRDSGLVGFKMHVRLRPSMWKKVEDHCSLFVFEHGYGGISPIENGLANLCFLFDRNALQKVGTDWDSLISHIAHHNIAASHYLDGVDPQEARFVTVANIPYGFVRRASRERGIFCVGDQMAVIPSLTGDGMSIAMMTGICAAEMMLDAHQHGQLGSSMASRDYHRLMIRRLRKQVEIGFQVHRLFRNPALCDWAARGVHAYPKVLDWVFRHTRCPLPLPKSLEEPELTPPPAESPALSPRLY